MGRVRPPAGYRSVYVKRRGVEESHRPGADSGRALPSFPFCLWGDRRPGQGVLRLAPSARGSYVLPFCSLGVDNMTLELKWISDGTVTAPLGWRAGAVHAGIKTYGVEPRLDLALLASEQPCSAAGVFTRNAVCGAPVTLSRSRVGSGRAQAVIVNSGCSNVATGEAGQRDAQHMTELAALKLGVAVEHVLVASTGVIGRPLPMDRIQEGVPRIALSPDGGADFARAIMTTDTVPKTRAVRFEAAGRAYTVGGAAKGSGMVHPDMATVLCFLTTDAPAEPAWLRETLRGAADVSLNMIDVDSDTSTSDTMLLFANGAAGGSPIRDEHPAAHALKSALETVAMALARDLARDGEGANTLIEVVVQGAATPEDARKAARTVASSLLVKAMVAGKDPNLGRVMMAIGRSGAQVDVAKVSVWISEHCAFQRGLATDLDHRTISSAMNAEQVQIRVDLGLGSATATAWGCDLTKEYVRINADDTT